MIVQYYFGVNCIGYLDILPNIFSYMKKCLIESHVKISDRNYWYARFGQKLLLFLQGAEVQNEGISDPTKRTYVLQFFSKKQFQ